MNNFSSVAETWTVHDDKVPDVTHKAFEDATEVSGGANARESVDVQVHPIWAMVIEGERRRLRKPVRLRVQREGDHFFAENESFEICGYGATRKEAVAEAVADIVYYCAFYSGLSEDEVVGNAKVLKDRYQYLIVDQ